MRWSILSSAAVVAFMTVLASAGPVAAQAVQCSPSAQMPLEGRPSPLDSTMVSLGDGDVKVCYGRPSARGRTMIGGEDVPFGQPWRAGANEPTTLHTNIPLQIAGISVDAGSYSIYVVPGEEEWEVVLNSSVNRWGIPINADVRANDIDSATVPRMEPDSYVETLLIHFENAGGSSADLVLEWEDFQIEIPVTADPA